MHDNGFTLKDELISNLPDKCRGILKTELADYGVSTITENRKQPLNIYLILTQGCNLSCPYCYQAKDFKNNNKQMTKEIIDSAVKFAVKTFHETAIAFTLFGGEPFTRFDLIKYVIEKYPMFRYRIITNGYVLNEQPEVYDWVWNHKDNCNISISLSALKFKYGKDYLEKTSKLLDLLNHIKGEIHYVIDDPQEDTHKEVIKIMEKCKSVRISCARHNEKLKEIKEKVKEVFHKIADYLYFGETVVFGRCTWDTAFGNNTYRYNKGLPLYDLPSTFCGCGGHLYLAILPNGDLFPCDYFSIFPEMKMGDIYLGLNPNSIYLTKMQEWVNEAFEKCRNCTHIPNNDLRLCARALCFAENYEFNKNPFISTEAHCTANEIESDVYNYISKKAIASGLDEVFYNKKKER